MPKISVILPVYNAEKYLDESLGSVLNQTFRDFEVLAIDDGSSDNSLSKLTLAAENDSRIRIIKNEKNLGLVDTLNKGIDTANGQYIVRMDADDICMPIRFERQVLYMDSKPNIGIAGSWVNFFEKSNYIVKVPETHEQIKARLLFRSPIIHPSTIMRTETLSKHSIKFRKEYAVGEDYAFWVEALDYTEIANIPEVLLKFRISDDSFTIRKRSKEARALSYNCLKTIHGNMLYHLDLTTNDHQYLVHHFIGCGNDFIDDSFSILEVFNYLNTIYEANCKVNYFNKNALAFSLTISLFSTLRLYDKNQILSNIKAFVKLKPSWLLPGLVASIKQRLL